MPQLNKDRDEKSESPLKKCDAFDHMQYTEGARVYMIYNKRINDLLFILFTVLNNRLSMAFQRIH